jgi:hypothetical protein
MEADQGDGASLDTGILAGARANRLTTPLLLLHCARHAPVRAQSTE